MERKMKKRILAVGLIVIGLMLAVTWWASDATKFPVGVGNSIFRALGLPVWSKEATGYPIGTHYPTVLGGVFMWGGLVVLRSTMSKMQNRRMAIIIAALFVIALLWNGNVVSCTFSA